MSSDKFYLCAFCPTEKRDIYTCPKCERYYCSVRCYRSKKHSECSENFYREQCEEQTGEKAPAPKEKSDTKIERPSTTFEEYMRSKGQCETPNMNSQTANPQIKIGADEEIVFDSDDEPEYLMDVVQNTVRGFENLDTNELDRKMMLAGISSIDAPFTTEEEQMEKLYAHLNDEERKAFTSKMFRRSKLCCDVLCKSLFLPTSSLNASRKMHSQSDEVFHPEMTSSNQAQNWVIKNISEVVSDPSNRLFAVVYIHRKQFKVSQGDIIQLEQNICLDVGEKIKFSKVLFVGGEDFSVIGRPLLDSDYVDVNATVIEKTTTSPSVKYTYAGNHPHDVQWWSKELTVLRVNDVRLDKRIFD